MAERGDKGLVSKIPENADINLFAEDLIHNVMIQYSPNYNGERSSVSSRGLAYNAFDETTQRAIYLYGKIVEDYNRNSFHYMQVNCPITSYTFISFANSLSTSLVENCFTQGFSAIDFLFYCANISRMAALFYNHGAYTAPVLARTNIINILRRYMPSDRWHSIHRAAAIAVNISRANEPMQRNTDLPEVEILNETQDEVNVSGSRNSSQCGDQNILSETEEISIDQEIENACSKYEASLQRYAQYFTERVSKLDSNELNKSNSSTSNFDGNTRKCNESLGLKDKPGSGVSNIDNKPIHIKTGCRKKFNSTRIDCKAIESQPPSFKSKKVVGKIASDDRICSGRSSAYRKPNILSKTNDKMNQDPNLNAKDNESPKIRSFEGDKHIDISSKAMFRTETLNIQQSSRLTNKKELDMISDGGKNANYQPMRPDEKRLVSETEPNEKLVSEIQSSKQASVHSAEAEFHFSSDRGNNANAKNVPPCDQEKSPKLKSTSMNTKLERFRSPSRDAEKSPPGKTNLK